MATIKDIAQKAGVSIGTVDRVLHNRGMVNEQTKQRILAVIKELDYHPNQAAQGLAGMSKDKARTMLQELTEIGLLVQVLVPKIGLEIYLQPLYTPGVFEFLLLNEPFCRAHPEIAYAFEQHATDSQTEHAMNTPMGAGIMRVIPVEAAIPAEAQQIDNERVSHYIELNADHLCALPCQCRRVRKLMNEGAGDPDESFCLFIKTQNSKLKIALASLPLIHSPHHLFS